MERMPRHETQLQGRRRRGARWRAGSAAVPLAGSGQRAQTAGFSPGHLQAWGVFLSASARAHHCYFKDVHYLLRDDTVRWG